MPDVIVVGTGVAGAGCAYALTRRGVRVLSVDCGADGQATAAGAGIIQPWSSSVPDDAWFALYAAGAAYYPTLVQRLDEDGVRDIGYRNTGGLVVSADPAALDEAEARTRERGVRYPGAGEISRVDLHQAREFDRDRVCGVRLGGQTVTADTVILAAGAWTNQLLAPLAVSVGVQPQRGQIVHLRLDGTDTSAWPSVHPLTGHYLVCFEDSRVVAGATRETGSGFDVRVTADGVREIMAAALELAPGLGRATHVQTRVGLRPLADGNRIAVGAVPGVAGLLLATGYGSGGLTLGPLTGELVADLVTTGAAPALIADLPPVISPVEERLRT